VNKSLRSQKETAALNLFLQLENTHVISNERDANANLYLTQYAKCLLKMLSVCKTS
jgi:hypothetical protein